MRSNSRETTSDGAHVDVRVSARARAVDASVARAAVCRRLLRAGCFDGDGGGAGADASGGSASAADGIRDAFRATPRRGDVRRRSAEAEIAASVVMRFVFEYWRERTRVRRVMGDSDEETVDG